MAFSRYRAFNRVCLMGPLVKNQELQAYVENEIPKTWFIERNDELNLCWNKTSSSRYSYGIGSNGHGAKVLIADGNFPLSTCTPAHCKRVFLNLSPRCSIRNGGFKSDQGVYPWLSQVR